MKPGPRAGLSGIVSAMGHMFGSMADRLMSPRGKHVSNAHMRDRMQPGWTVIEDNSLRCRCGVHFGDHQKRQEKCRMPAMGYKGNPKEKK